MKTALRIAFLLVVALAVGVSAQTNPTATPVATASSPTSNQPAHPGGPKGIAAKSSATAYPSHSMNDGAAVGAKLLTAEEARRSFSTDVNRCCVVVEVAIYPSADKPSEVSLNDFVLQAKSVQDASKPSSASVIATVLQKKARDQRDVNLSPHGSVGYGTGTDPIYGPYYGPSTTAIVGVGVSGRGTHPGSSDKDRSATETELSEKALPEGTAAAPVAGYLYFDFPRNKKAPYQLDYLLNGQKVVLELH